MTKIKQSAFWKKSQVVGNKLLELAGRLGNQKHLTIIRDGFAFFMPLVIAGALSVLVRAFIFGGAGAVGTSILGWIGMATGDAVKDGNGEWGFVAGTSLAKISEVGNFLFYQITHATFDMISLYMAFGLGYLLCKGRGQDMPLIGGLVSLGAFLVATFASPSLFNAQGLLTAMIVSFASTEIFCLLQKNGRMELKMPEGVPPAVTRAFAKLLPAIIVLLAVMAINLPFTLFGYLLNTPASTAGVGDSFPASWTLGSAIYAGIQSPFISFASTKEGGLGLALLFTTGITVLWFFGLHGANILGAVFEPIFLALYTDNVNGASNIFVKATFDAFTYAGGSGATLGLIVAILIFSRNKPERELAKMSFGPGIFNINEPMIFGTPLILNMKYAFPFVTTQPILTITTYLGFTWFNIHPVTVMIPWTAPFPIGGLLATALDWKGFVLAAFNLALSFALYLPWVLMWGKRTLGETVKKETVIEAPKTTPVKNGGK